MLEGGCTLPIAVCTTVSDGRLELKARVYDQNGDGKLEMHAEGEIGEAEATGRFLANRLRE